MYVDARWNKNTTQVAKKVSMLYASLVLLQQGIPHLPEDLPGNRIASAFE